MASSAALQHMHVTRPNFMRLAAIALGVLTAAAALVWVVPGMLDWGRYRGSIARFASDAMGRPVHIDGRVSLVLLPAPILTANGVWIGESRSDGLTLSAPALRLRLAFAPLLLGRVVPRDLVLSSPAIHLPWPLPPSTLATRRPAWLAGSSARIEHGTLAVGALLLTDVNADFGASDGDIGDAGLVVSGSARSFGRSWRFTDRLGAPDSAGAAPFEAVLDAQPQSGSVDTPDADGHFVGTLDGAGALTGRLTAQAADLSRLLPAPPVAAHAEGTIALGAGPARAELTLDIGGVPVAAQLHPGRRRNDAQIVSLTTVRLDLDAWRAALARLRAQGGRAAKDRLPQNQLIVLPWPVSLDFHADAMRLQGGVMSGVHAALDVDGQAGVLHTLTATLPGGAALALAGTLRMAPNAQGVDAQVGLSLAGTATLDAPVLRDTLGWLQRAGLRLGDALPPDVLRDAHLAARITADRDHVALSDLAGGIDRSRVTAGRIGVDTASGAIDADLTLDRVAANDWLPDGTAHDWPAISHHLASTDVMLKLHVAAVQLGGRVLANLALDAATDAGGLAVNALSFDLDGLHAAAAGTIGGDGDVSDASLDLTGRQATSLAAYLPDGIRLPDYLWSGPVDLHVEASGPQDALVVSLGLDLADARLEAHPLIDLKRGKWSAQMTLRHPGAPRLLGALGLPKARIWLGEGSLSLLAQLEGGPGAMAVRSFDLTAGTLHATGDLAVSSPPNGAPSLTGQVRADTLPLPSFTPHATTPMALGVLQGWNAQLGLTAGVVTSDDVTIVTNAAATLALQSGILTLTAGHATLAGGSLTGTARLDTTAQPPQLTVQADLAHATLTDGLFGTPLDLASGTLAAGWILTAHGYSPAAIAATLTGDLHLDGIAGTLAGIDLAAAHRAQLPSARLDLPAALAGGTTKFDHLHLTAKLANGIATLDPFRLDGPDGTASASGTIDLSAATLDLLAILPDQLALRLNGAIASPRRTPRPVSFQP